MAIQVIKPTRAEILKCVAKYKELKGVDKGLPDMVLENCRRTFFNVLGFAQPEGDDQYSPFGDEVTPQIGHLHTGFGASFVKAQPGRGVLMHTHDTSESFMPVEGRWKIEWEGDQGNDYVLLDPFDFISLPVGVQRRFECVEAPAGKQEGTLFAIITGDKPAGEYSPESMRLMSENALLQERETQGA